MKNNLVLVMIVLFAVISIPLTLLTDQKQQSIKNQAQVLSARSATTTFTFRVYLDGVGSRGDSLNPNDTSLNTRYLSSRNIVVSVFNTNNQLLKKVSDSIYYDNQKGDFYGTADLGTNIPAGNFIIKLKSDSYLQKRIPGTIQITPLTTINTNIPEVSLVAGDLNNDNKIDVLDYNMMMGCYSDILAASFCDNTRLKLADLNGDYAVNMLDLNLFLREISVQQNGD